MSKQRVRICNKENVRPGYNDSEQKIQGIQLIVCFLLQNAKECKLDFEQTIASVQYRVFR